MVGHGVLSEAQYELHARAKTQEGKEKDERESR
jgi:hypothetical protein